MKSCYKKLLVAAGVACAVGGVAGILCTKLHRSAAKNTALAGAGSADGIAEPVSGCDDPDYKTEEAKESDGVSDEEE